jgi:predicted AlkP superfamily pyrophosphatase or phosphodiesterase
LGLISGCGVSGSSLGAIEKPLNHQGLIRQALEQIERFGSESSPAWRDQIWTDAAVDIIEHHTPDLMLIHLLETDSPQHQHGPLTPAAYAADAYADTCLARIVDAVRIASMLDRTTVFVMADHGFATYQNVIRPNALLREKGMIAEAGGHLQEKVWVQAEGGAAEVFIIPSGEEGSCVVTMH